MYQPWSIYLVLTSVCLILLLLEAGVGVGVGGEREERVGLLALIFLAATVSLSDRAKARKNALSSG